MIAILDYGAGNLRSVQNTLSELNCEYTLVNDAAEADFIAEAAAELVGADHVDRNSTLVMASEDFSYMLNRSPGAYIRIGNGDEPGGRASGDICGLVRRTLKVVLAGFASSCTQ